MIYKKSATFRDKFKVSLSDTINLLFQTKEVVKAGNGINFHSWIESPHFFHLYFDSRSFFIIPKDAFAEDELHEITGNA